MSVIVKGMEMPGACWDCVMSRFDVCKAVGRTYDPDPGQPKRPDWCPLRPLPEKHGRLCDFDEIKNKLAKDKREAFTKHDVWLMLSRYGAETIVEAEA